MPLRKCPKCELNYILDDAPFCTVCLKEAKGIDHHDDEGELCPLCGEREIVFGEEYCTECLSDLKKLDSKQSDDEPAEEEEEEVDEINDLEEIPMDEEAEAVPAFELEHINEALTEGETYPEAEDALDDDDEEFEGDDEEPLAEEEDD